jgi:hypothetical protein
VPGFLINTSGELSGLPGNKPCTRNALFRIFNHCVMINFFRRVPVYIKIYPDKIEITDIRADQTVSKSPLFKYSSARLIVADFIVASDLISQILKELGLNRRTLKALIQQMDYFEDELSEVEKRVLRDLGEQAGASEVYIVNRKKTMSREEILEFLLLKNFKDILP